jgi:hypothetical protein
MKKLGLNDLSLNILLLVNTVDSQNPHRKKPDSGKSGSITWNETKNIHYKISTVKRFCRLIFMQLFQVALMFELFKLVNIL